MLIQIGPSTWQTWVLEQSPVYSGDQDGSNLSKLKTEKKEKKTKVSKEFGIKFDNSEAAISSGVQTLNISTVVKPQIKSKPQNICYK